MKCQRKIEIVFQVKVHWQIKNINYIYIKKFTSVHEISIAHSNFCWFPHPPSVTIDQFIRFQREMRNVMENETKNQYEKNDRP